MRKNRIKSAAAIAVTLCLTGLMWGCGVQGNAEPSPEEAEILSAADVRREKILNSPTDIAVEGRSYFVSADGDDSNDGRSPETPWATLDKVNSIRLKSGDGVFFRRGDVWRGKPLIAQEGVTYSAYGEGPKPGIYGSPENGAHPSKWSLMEGTDNIWVFYKDMMDCGDIVLDGSMDLADKAPVWWSGHKYVKHISGNSYDSLMNKPDFDPAKDMQDMQYFNDIDYSDLGSQHPIFVYQHAERTGKLYFRCDEGNPGEIYESIEFCCDPNEGCVVTLNYGQGSVIDNLAVLYGGHAIEARGGKLVQNCQVGYMGAMTHTFLDAETIYSGDGINHTTDMTVQNNYVHHCFNGGIAAGELSNEGDGEDAHGEDIQGNSSVRGNLLEYTCGITLLNWEEQANPLRMFKNITIEDNYVMHSSPAGNPTGRNKANDVIGGLVFSGSDNPLPCANENLVIRDNVFYLSGGPLIISGMPEEYYPIYSGNTYVQYHDGIFACWRFRDGTFSSVPARSLGDAEAFVRNELGDENGLVFQAKG